MNSTTARTKVWPWPVRFAHYNLLLCLPLLLLTGNMGWLYWHAALGLWLMAVLLFRVTYALMVTDYASFRSLLYSPIASLSYLWSVIRAKEVQPYPGHNPAGSNMVLLLWGLLLLQIGLGLFSSGTIFYQGPLAHWISFELSLQLTDWHKQMPGVLLVLIALHIAAVLWTQFALKERILKAIFVDGEKEGQFATGRLDARAMWIALSIAMLLLAVVVGLGYQGGFWRLIP